MRSPAGWASWDRLRQPARRARPTVSLPCCVLSVQLPEPVPATTAVAGYLMCRTLLHMEAQLSPTKSTSCLSGVANKPHSQACEGVLARAASHAHMGHAAVERSGASVRSVSAKAGAAWQGAPASRRPSHARMSTVWGERETAHSRRSRLVVQCAPGLQSTRRMREQAPPGMWHMRFQGCGNGGLYVHRMPANQQLSGSQHAGLAV